MIATGSLSACNHRGVDGRDDPVDAGEELLGQPAPSGRRRIAYAVGAILLAAGVITGVLTRGHGGHPHAAQSRTATPSRSVGPSGPHLPPPPPTDTTDPVASAPSLPHLGDVQLFARAASAVIEINFAAGWVVGTPIPALRSSGPATFGVTDTGAYVRPIDAVPGYFVRSGAPALELTGSLADAAVLPGPDPESVWVEESRAGRLTALRGVHMPAGTRTSATLTAPAGGGPYPGPPQSDGSGFVLVAGAHGTFDLRPDGAHRLPVDLLSSTVLASGGDRLLVAGCSPSQRRACPVWLIRLPDGARTRLGSLPLTASLPPGVIAPDARSALIYQPAARGQVAAQLIDLGTGRPSGSAVPVDASTQPGTAAYSADGRWVFLVGSGGTLVVVDARTGAAQRIAAGLPVAYQLAVRG